MELYVSDLDGTLFNSDTSLSEKTIKTVNKLIDNGYNFTYATARGYDSSREKTKKLNLKLPIITNNGARIVYPDGSDLLTLAFDKEKLKDLFTQMEKLDISPMIHAVIDGEERASWLVDKESPGIKSFVSNRKGEKRLRPVDNYEDLYLGDIIYIIFIGDYKEALELEYLFKDNPYLEYHIIQDTYKKDEYWLEVFKKGATKANGINKLKEIIKADNLIVFGDHINDISMFEIADKSLAMENGHKDLKKIATEIIDTNDNDGVANWLINNIGV